MFQNKIFLYNTLKKNNFGFGYYFFKILISRLEFSKINHSEFLSWQRLLFDNFLNNFKINKYSFRTKHLLNVYLLNLLGTYRGWRHSRGLPVRGQRTWSNGWSSYRSNLILRSYKIILSKKIYGQNILNDGFTAYVAEEVNNMWRLQWGNEWLLARKKRINSQKTIKVYKGETRLSVN